MDALDLLISDHNRLRGLFQQFDEAKAREDRPTLEAVAAKMHAELGVHTTIEEEILYPAIQGLTDELGDEVAEGLEEHHEVNLLMAEVVRLAPDQTEWIAKWTVIIENTEHHAGEEENEMFPKVRSHTDATWRNDLGDHLDRRKGELGAPTTADREDLTVEQIRELASAQLIPGRSTMTSDELRATVSPG